MEDMTIDRQGVQAYTPSPHGLRFPSAGVVPESPLSPL